MSELFNALQKLEEKNISEAPSLPPLTSRAGKSRRKQHIPYLKSFLLLALITVMTAIGLFVLTTEKPDIFPPQLEQTLPALQEPLLPPDTIKQPDITKAADNLIPAAVTGEEEVSLLPLAEAETAKEMEAQDQQPTIVAPGFGKTAIVIGEMVIFPITVNALADPLRNKELAENDIGQYPHPQVLATEIIHERRQQVRKKFIGKRLLQRAERLRHEGELVKALELYKKAWHEKPGAALANNIAAILINRHSYQEAEDYLLQALRFSPNDPDIIFNLKLIEQRRKHGVQ